MHLIPDSETSQDEIFLEPLFCSMQKLKAIEFYEKWKSINKKYQQIFSIGKLYSSRESSIIKRLQANQLLVCAFKSLETSTMLYLCCTTKDNLIILIELTLTKSDCLKGSIKYKSERMTRESDLESFISMILCHNECIELEEPYCR